MRKKAGRVSVLFLFAIFLSSCVYLRPVGPCYGFGCPAFTQGPTSQPTKAENKKARDGRALAKNRKTAPPEASQGK
jgi:hypothetical protein